MPHEEKLTTDDLINRIQEVRRHLADACARSGRSPDEVALIAVTKTFPAEIVERAIAAGLTAFGENRVQELVAKSDAIPGKAMGGDIAWHQIGPVQRNKAKDVAQRADVFHALDSIRLAKRLNRLVGEVGRKLPCFVQVNVSGEVSKSGIPPDDLGATLNALSAFDNLEIIGLMTIPSPANSPEELETVVRPQLRHLRELAEGHANGLSGVSLERLSMGMSDDFEIAIEEGATDIRLGSALFGERMQ